MQRFTTSLLSLGVLAAAVSCGAPAELDEGSFPSLEEAGYTDSPAGAGAQPLGGNNAGNGAAPPAGGATGGGQATSPTPAANGASGTGTPAAGGAAPAGGGAAPAGGGAAPAGGGAAPAGGGAAPAAGGGAPVASGGGAGGCPDDITLLFNRPITEGGCNGSMCHVPGATAPDLVSPGVETRLLNVTSQCNGRPYIGADDSYLADKIAGSPPECGLAMPFFMPQALSQADEDCILSWIEEVSGG